MPTTILKAENLTKRFGAFIAVQNLSLDVHQGEIFGLLGPNGAGKTTSISMICGLLKPDGGHVFIQGKAVHNGETDIRVRVGVCPQNIIIWGQLTCLEQLQFIGEMYGLPGKDCRQRGLRLLEELGLAEKQNALGRTLSGGMQRRLNLALALVHDPEILVLDEPEAGLDPQSRVLVREFVKSLARRKTVILTTHNIDEAERMADRVAIIDHGSLLVVDTPAALKSRVGNGDVLEIDLPENQSGAALEAVRVAAGHAERAMTNHTLVVRARAAVSLLPGILEALQAAGIPPGEVRLRANTLEDVFISLTGRRLRE